MRSQARDAAPLPTTDSNDTASFSGAKLSTPSQSINSSNILARPASPTSFLAARRVLSSRPTSATCCCSSHSQFCRPDPNRVFRNMGTMEGAISNRHPRPLLPCCAFRAPFVRRRRSPARHPPSHSLAPSHSPPPTRLVRRTIATGDSRSVHHHASPHCSPSAAPTFSLCRLSIPDARTRGPSRPMVASDPPSEGRGWRTWAPGATSLLSSAGSPPLAAGHHR